MSDTDDLAAAADEGRVEYPPCPTCGVPVTAWALDRGFREVTHELQPMWEGGPMVSVPLTFPRLEHVPEGDRFTSTVCGHEIPVEAMVFRIRPRPPRSWWRRVWHALRRT